MDTDLVISFLRGYADAVKKVVQLQRSSADLSITSITLCELYRGAFLSSDKEKNLSLANQFIEGVTLLTQDKLSCLFFGQDYALLKNKGLQTGEMDLMIASICKAHDCVLVTRNIKDFRNIPNLMIEKW
ncbi:type II toxin-antitoxin system VapC family toxin [Candidatus Woesearchaeota archaeon]|nr:type II toxin-antitoxin system VapC family toxin [Candidatus Woesearchaeota archaeon]